MRLQISDGNDANTMKYIQFIFFYFTTQLQVLFYFIGDVIMGHLVLVQSKSSMLGQKMLIP